MMTAAAVCGSVAGALTTILLVAHPRVAGGTYWSLAAAGRGHTSRASASVLNPDPES